MTVERGVTKRQIRRQVVWISRFVLDAQVEDECPGMLQMGQRLMRLAR